MVTLQNVPFFAVLITSLNIDRSSSVGIATGYTLNKRGSIPARGKVCSYCAAFRPAVGAIQPPLQMVQEVTGA